MARRNSLRSWLAASVLMFSGMAGVLASPVPAGAAAATGPVNVWVYPTYFQVEKPADPSRPNIVWAKPKQKIVFTLVDPSDRNHTVTVDPAKCADQPRQLCDKSFDDPNDPTVEFLWYTEGEYGFFDQRSPATGTFIIYSGDPTVSPSPTTTTTTMAPTTTTTAAPTTTTTAPTAIRPMLVPDPPASTTTTTLAANPAPSPTTAPASKPGDKDKDRAKKASSPSTPTTVAPGPDGTMPPDSVFDPAALTPSPTLTPAPDGSNGDEAAIDASAAASLLDPQQADDDGSKLLLMAFAALALMLMIGGGWAWFTRASRYDPA